MPYNSEALRKYIHANKKNQEKHGVDVEELDMESKGLKLPKSI